MKAMIHSFESFATLDGEGIRYAVFFAGCPLRCICCHNPDTWFAEGREMGSKELSQKLCRYKAYFKNGGGVTFSGGEPLLYASFINETYRYLQHDQIGYVLDTSGAVTLTKEVKTAVDSAQLVILDVKYPGRKLYEQYTHGDFDTFLRFAEYVSETKKRVWYRTVIIPGVNDTEEVLKEYVRLISQWHRPEKYELLPFHTMGFYKYEDLGIENPLKNTTEMDKGRLQELQEYLDGLNKEDDL